MKFLKKISQICYYDTPWCGNEADKLYLQSGQFTSTLKKSEYIGGIDIVPSGISYDGTDTPWAGYWDKKLYRNSGQFTSTIKDSEDISGIDTALNNISYDGINTPWTGYTDKKLYLQSGQFTSTLLKSQYIGSIDTVPTGISYSGTDTPWCGTEAAKLYRQSGQFTSTIKDSENVTSIDTGPQGISYDGTNTPWVGEQADKLYLQSGQFTSTLIKSRSISIIDMMPSGICTNDIDGRLPGNIYNRSTNNTISLGQNIVNICVYSRLVSNTASLGQNIFQSGSIFNRSLFNTVSLGQNIVSLTIYSYSQFNTISLNQNVSSQLLKLISHNHTVQLTQLLLFNHQLIISKIFGLPTTQTCRLNLSRWIFASTSKYFGEVAANNNLHYFVEGTIRETEEHQKYIEFRLNGPNFTQLSKGLYKLDIEINILWSFNQDDEDFHEPERIKGILIDAMDDICVYKFGDGPYDDDSFVDTLRLKQNRRRAICVNNFGQVRSDVRLMQGTVGGGYSMYHSC